MDSATRRKAMTMYAQSCGVDVEELEVTENGTYTAPSGKAYSPVIVNVNSGGGNPNRVQTVTGTLAQPFGDYDLYESLLDAVTNGNASAQLEFVFNDVPQKLPLLPNVGLPGLVGSAASIGVEYGAARALWSDPVQGEYLLGFARMVGTATGGQIVDISSMAPGISSTLTIIWHPLPEVVEQ